MFHIWEKIATDEEISKCKGDYNGCNICRNKTRCFEILIDRLVEKALDESGKKNEGP